MHHFEPHPDMLSLSGAFYPTGYIFLMFPSEVAATQAAESLSAGQLSEKPVMLLRPEDTLTHIVRTVGGADTPLPSVGAESSIVRGYAELASQGHWALLVYAPNAKDADAVMAALADNAPSSAMKYRLLVIEDLL